MSSNVTSTTQPSRTSTLMRRATRLVGPIGRALAGHRWFTLYGLLIHRGRTSGREYRIPVVRRPLDDGFVIPMPWGASTQWVKNVEAAGGARIIWNGRAYDVVAPEGIDADAAGPALSGVQRTAVGRLGMNTFMRLR